MEVGARRLNLHSPAFRNRRGVRFASGWKIPRPRGFSRGRGKQRSRRARSHFRFGIWVETTELREGWDYAEGGGRLKRQLTQRRQVAKAQGKGRSGEQAKVLRFPWRVNDLPGRKLCVFAPLAFALIQLLFSGGTLVSGRIGAHLGLSVVLLLCLKSNGRERGQTALVGSQAAGEVFQRGGLDGSFVQAAQVRRVLDGDDGFPQA